MSYLFCHSFGSVIPVLGPFDNLLSLPVACHFLVRVRLGTDHSASPHGLGLKTISNIEIKWLR